MLVDIAGSTEGASDPQCVERIRGFRDQLRANPAMIKQLCERALVMQWAETDTDRATLLFWYAEALLAEMDDLTKLYKRDSVKVPLDRVGLDNVSIHAQRAVELAYKADRPDYLLIVGAECLHIKAAAHTVSHDEFIDAVSQLQKRINGFSRLSSDQRDACAQMITELEGLSSKHAADGRFTRV